MKEVDIIIVSNAKNWELRQVTEACLVSLLQSEIDIRFQVFVIESVKGVNYDRPGVTTVYPKEAFGYHAYLNLGRKMGSAPYVCLCNNDLIFAKNWASEIITAMEVDPSILSASPFCRHFHPSKGIKPNSGLLEGYQIARLITGWCIFQQRKIYEIIGDLDESFIFWYADNDYGETIKHHKVKHTLVTSSFVDHLISRTLRTANSTQRRQLTHSQKMLFMRKWKKRI